MKEPAKAPTKMCPHRWCRRLHRVIVGLSVVSVLLSTNLSVQVLGVVVLLSIAWSWWLRWRGFPSPPLPFDKPNPWLQVRKGWARAAAALDVAVILMILQWTAAAIALRAAGLPTGPGSDPMQALIGAVISVVLYGSLVLCHYMATKPAKPKRVRVPTNASFGAA